MNDHFSDVNHFSVKEVQSTRFSFLNIAIRTCCVAQFLQTCLNFHIHCHISNVLDPRSFDLQSYFHCDEDSHGSLYCESLTVQFHPCDVGFHE